MREIFNPSVCASTFPTSLAHSLFSLTDKERARKIEGERVEKTLIFFYCLHTMHTSICMSMIYLFSLWWVYDDRSEEGEESSVMMNQEQCWHTYTHTPTWSSRLCQWDYKEYLKSHGLRDTKSFTLILSLIIPFPSPSFFACLSSTNQQVSQFLLFLLISLPFSRNGIVVIIMLCCLASCFRFFTHRSFMWYFFL